MSDNTTNGIPGLAYQEFTSSAHGVCCRITVPIRECGGSGHTEPAMSQAARDAVKKRQQDHGLNPDYPEHRPMHESEG